MNSREEMQHTIIEFNHIAIEALLKALECHAKLNLLKRVDGIERLIRTN